jgi:hypothetical protein
LWSGALAPTTPLLLVDLAVAHGRVIDPERDERLTAAKATGICGGCGRHDGSSTKQPSPPRHACWTIQIRGGRHSLLPTPLRPNVERQGQGWRLRRTACLLRPITFTPQQLGEYLGRPEDLKMKRGLDANRSYGGIVSPLTVLIVVLDAVVLMAVVTVAPTRSRRVVRTLLARKSSSPPTPSRAER